MNDDYAAEIPQRFFRTPKSFRLAVARYRLTTDQEEEIAVRALHKLDVHAALGALSRFKDAESHALPLKVTARSVLPRKGLMDLSRAEVAYAQAADSSNRLASFVDNVRTHFTQEGIEHFRKPVNLHEPERPEISIDRFYLLSSKKVMTTFRAREGWMLKKRKHPHFDLRGLVQKYKDEVWGESILLEKLSLCKEGRIVTFGGSNKRRIIDEEYEEIASIPLPTEESS